MLISFIVVIVLVVILILLGGNNNIKVENENVAEDFSKFKTNKYVMTQTELVFYRELKKVTDSLNLSVFPQVDLERIINVVDNNRSDRGKIKSRSIDYTIVENSKCKIICCIELDDYTHNRKNVKKSDEFKNNLFRQVNIPLYRIKVNNKYNIEELENMIKQNI